MKKTSEGMGLVFVPVVGIVLLLWYLIQGVLNPKKEI